MKINFDMEGRIKIQRRPFCIELLIKKITWCRCKLLRISTGRGREDFA